MGIRIKQTECITTNPVSYTHLDVYKRQQRYHPPKTFTAVETNINDIMTISVGVVVSDVLLLN